MINRNKKETLFQGALILTLASLLSKVLSAVYRVPFQNMVGDEGFYIFQQAYPFYGISMTLSLTAAPLFLSKLMAEHSDDNAKQRYLLQQGQRYLTLLGFVLFSVLFFGATVIARLMGDVELAGIVKVTSVTYLLLPFLGSYRGYYQGLNNMTPTAISQAIEQLIRVFIIIVAAYIGVHVLTISLYRVGELAMSGAIIGGLVAAFLLWRFDGKRYPHERVKQQVQLELPSGIWRDMIAVLITSALLIWFQMADAFQVYRLLVEQGMAGEQAKIIKGIYDRGQPLIQLGAVVVTSFSLSIIPMISQARIRQQRMTIERLVSFFMRTGIALGVAITAALVMMMPTLNYVLFADYEGVSTLRILVGGLLLLTLLIIVTSVLQGFNIIKAPAMAAACGIGVKLYLNHLWIGPYGISGSAWATNVALLVSLFISTLILRRFVSFRVPTWQFVAKLSVCVMLMLVPLAIIESVPLLQQHRLLGLLGILVASSVGAVVFIVAASFWRVITPQDIVLLPLGRTLLNYVKKRKR
ncbi:putative polysaccharide biosynthesis protein [Brochothrix campestris]|uniref:Polysaccharide biosynthesis family protein n=1 Tax=Brochothrix campestris FSL F6-1037 TaxID=1265861 RepID=W7CL26_9LIST|nr:polysaccharide biosynthesis protein [Brochothrix campestris]EUJ36586.1 polysaccharide biosynthesis family protein [Brochothrix campestris FSL F6-1037]